MPNWKETRPTRGAYRKCAPEEGVEEVEVEVEGSSCAAPVEVVEKVEVDLYMEDKTIHLLHLRPSTALKYMTQLERSVLNIGRT